MMLRRRKATLCRCPSCGDRIGACAFAALVVAAVALSATPARGAEPDAGSDPSEATGPSNEAHSEPSAPPSDGATPPASEAAPPASEDGASGAPAPPALEPAPAASAPPASPNPPPTGPAPQSAPPPVVAADPNWHEPASVDDEYIAPPPKRSRESTVDVALGAQVFNPRGKVMTGPVFRIGENVFWVAIEFSPIWLVEDSPDFDGSVLGNQWGFHVELAPLRTPRVELLAGGGLDVYHLWGIHGDEALFALTVKLEAQYRLTKRASMFVTLRGYPLSSSGLELGRDRRGDMLVPVLGSVGVEWRWE